MTPINTPNNITQITAESWPKVQIGKQTLEVKWGVFPRFVLSSWGISAEKCLEAMRSPKLVTPEVKDDEGNVVTPAHWTASPEYTARSMEVFAACVAHNYKNLGMEPPDAAHWASIIEEDEWTDCIRAIGDAMGKEKEARDRRQEKAQAALPKSEPAQTTPTLQ